MTTLLDLTDTALPKGKIKVPPRPAPKSQQVVKVNGVEITESEVVHEMQNHPAGDPAKARYEAVRALVVRQLLVQRAEALGLVAVPEAVGDGKRELDEDALIRQLLDVEVAAPRATVKECRRYYDANIDKFQSETLFEARHILFPAAPDDKVARDAARDQASAVIDLLSKSPTRFAELVDQYSACPSKLQGGNLGQLSRGSTVLAFEAALFAMEAGELSSKPVASPFGYHIIRLDRKVPGTQLPFEAVQVKIAGWLEASSWCRIVSQYVARLAAAADIAGFVLDGPGSQAVQ